MAENPVSWNALGWVQLQLLGGWRRVAATSALYVAAAAFFLVLIYRATWNRGTTAASFAGSSMTVLFTIQALLLVALGSNTLRRAVQRDCTTDMLGSHRQTAMTGIGMAIGYLTGPTIQAMALTLANWLICTALAMIAGQSAMAPTVFLVFLGCVTSLSWTIALLTALFTRGNPSLVGLLIGFGIIGGSSMLSLIPGLGLLIGIGVNQPLSRFVAGVVTDWTLPIAMASQLAYAFIFFVASARKCSTDERPAFTPLLAHAALAILAVLCWIGLDIAIDTQNRWAFDGPGTDVQFIASISLLAFVSLLPVANAARNEAIWAMRRAKDPDDRHARPQPFWAPVVWTTLIVGLSFALILGVDSEIQAAGAKLFPAEGVSMWLLCLLVFFLAVCPLTGLFRFMYGIRSKILWMGGLYLFLIWILPILLDVMLAVIDASEMESAPSWVFGCSPIGQWIAIVSIEDVNILPGLLFQIGLCALSIPLGRRAMRIHRPPPMAAAITPN